MISEKNINNLVESSFRGCILITKGNEILIQKTSGYADLANRIPNEINTKFATASAGKVFVAVGILQLIEKGLLHFNDKIGELLNFDLKAIDSQITIEQLLTHSSGIPDYFDESIMNEYDELWVDFPNYRIRSNKDLLPLFIDKPMQYPRGSKFKYNNTGFVILAMIIEELTGLDFDKYLKEKIFAPCGMFNTGYYELDKLPAKCAFNYIYNETDKDYRTNIFSVDAKGTGAGGAFTTVNDIKLFWENLMSNKLISIDMTATMMTNHSYKGHYYGYGIWLEKQCNLFIPYFQGYDPGVSFISTYIKNKDILITMVSNYGDNVYESFNKLKTYFT